ncbi:NADPH-dependent FMN reductase [Roseibium limicola]|uniref:NAD(P)H-dependent oxidoreductase n=1 Tax=Roseibium limicola TaxID=2816037 RepID=A0A939EM56_9HYPH|nr:NADPH-dependent FMN reductase [Roseibium limicola]MBO0344700.1 NAD(P)H-dependent oxidoreductase [Roseibium limicola]
MTEKLKVMAICGSLRKGSLNQMVANTLQELAPADMTLVQAPSIADIPLYNADLQNDDGFPVTVDALAAAIEEADAIIFVSPEYNYSVPGVLKNAIDWVSRLPNHPFKQKPIALQSAAAGMLGGARMQYHLRQILVFLEADVFNKPEVFITFGKTKVDEASGRLTDEAAREVISAQLAAFGHYIQRVQS